MKPASVVPFPQLKRRRFIEIGARLAAVSPRTCEKLLGRNLAAAGRRNAPQGSASSKEEQKLPTDLPFFQPGIKAAMKIQRAIENFPTEKRPDQENAAIDFLTLTSDYVRPQLDRSRPIGDRLKALWAAVVTARDYGASDVVQEEFLLLARHTGLFADLGRRADVDLRHIVRWGLLNQNPFF